jgi:thymidylate kinase
MTRTNQHSPNKQRSIFEQALQATLASGIPLCVTNGYRVTDDWPNSDIDCMVPQNALPHHIISALTSRDLLIANQFQRESESYVLVVTSQSAPSNYIWLDLSSSFRQEGRIFYSSEEILPYAIQKDGGTVPAPHHEFGMYLVKKILQRRLTHESADRLTELYSIDPEGCESEIRRFWTSPSQDILIRCASSGDWSHVLEQLSPIRAELLSTHLRERLEYYLPELSRRAKRFLVPSGFFIVLMGPDGVGKTTIGNQLEASLSPAFRRSQRVHFGPTIFRRHRRVATVTQPHRFGPRGNLTSTVKAIRWFVDFTVGYFVSIRVSKAKSTFVIGDRYLQDVSIDPFRYRFAGPVRLLKVIERLSPKPDLFVVLDAPAEVVQQRKREVPFAETERQRKSYREFAAKTPNAILVDATLPPHQIAAELTDEILALLNDRILRRLGLDQ